jgi:hypothetical protein
MQNFDHALPSVNCFRVLVIVLQLIRYGFEAIRVGVCWLLRRCKRRTKSKNGEELCKQNASGHNYRCTNYRCTFISGETLTGFHPLSMGAKAPSIDSDGRVAFYATYSEGDFVGEGVFTPASLILKTGDFVDGETLDGISLDPVLNDGGMVVVRGLLGPQTYAMVMARTSLARIGHTIGGLTLTDFASPAINNRGTVAFMGSFASGTGIFTQTALLAKSGEVIGRVTPACFGPPAINDRGTVAFQGWFSEPRATAILTPTAVLVKTVIPSTERRSLISFWSHTELDRHYRVHRYACWRYGDLHPEGVTGAAGRYDRRSVVDQLRSSGD